jgi:hypothetical protein
LGVIATCLPAAADVVHLRNGRQIRGQVVEDGASGVVVKTRQGRLVLPAAQVAKIERESAAHNHLREAREARRDGDLDEAQRLLQHAKAAAEAEREEALLITIEGELRQLDGAAPRASAPEVPDRAWSGQGDPFEVPEDQALIRELSAASSPELRQRLVQELFKRGRQRHDEGDHRHAAADFRQAADAAQGDAAENLRRHEFRCRLEVAERALRDDACDLVRAACTPLLESPELAGNGLRRGAYLLGRAYELLRAEPESRRAFLVCLQGTPVPAERELATLRELARLRSVGVPITADTPGVSAGWRWLRTPHFAVLHQLAKPGGLNRALEQAHGDVVRRLDLGRLDERGRIALFLFANKDVYRSSASAHGWMAGHAQRVRTDDELIRSIYLYPGHDLMRRLRHEIAHILVGDALDDAVVPVWANEGVAVYAEGDASLERHYALAAAYRAQGRWTPLEQAVSRMLTPDQGDAEAIRAFYAQSAVMFDQLREGVGVRRTLQAMVYVNQEGPRALRRVGSRVDRLEDRVEQALERRKSE